MVPSPDNSHDFGAPVGGSFWCTLSGLMKTAPAKQFRDPSAQSETGFGERLNRGLRATGCRRFILLLKKARFSSSPHRCTACVLRPAAAGASGRHFARLRNSPELQSFAGLAGLVQTKA